MTARIERKGGITAGVAVQIIAVYTLTVVFVSALIMWLIDDDNFPNYGISLWWAVQTVTTVGYGDVVPETPGGRVVAAMLMLTGLAFIPTLTSVIVSALLSKTRRSDQARIEQLESEQAATLARIEERLERLEQSR